MFALLLFAAVSMAQNAGPFHVISKQPQADAYGWDYLAVDAPERRLYITRDTHVDVLDADTLKPVGHLAGLEGAHGVAIAPDLNRIFATSGRSGFVFVFDRKTLKPIGQVKTGDNPDAVVYDAKTHRVFAFNGRSKSATVIDATTNQVLSTIELGAKPEFAVSDDKGVIFDNLEDKNEIVAIDAATMKVTKHISLAPCDSPSGLSIDRAHRRLFAACDNEKLAVADADSGKIVTTVAIGHGPDAVAFDATENLIFVPNGQDGTLSVIHENTPDNYVVQQTATTQKGARTLTVDDKTHHVISIAAQFGAKPKPSATNPHGRPPIVDGSVVALVIDR